MKKKRILLVVVVLAILAVLCIALLSKSETQKEKGETSTQSTEQTVCTAETQTAESQSSHSQMAAVYEDGMFTFNASQFRERFVDTLPQGYALAKVIAANSSRNHKMQIDILDASGTLTGMGILLDVKESDFPLRQMALVIKEDAYEEDVAVMLNWYLSTFLDEFDRERQTLIHEDYLDMFCSRFEDYRLYSADPLAVMMSYSTEDSGKYYYVVISVQ